VRLQRGKTREEAMAQWGIRLAGLPFGIFAAIGTELRWS
jgi:hypothetical protein